MRLIVDGSNVILYQILLAELGIDENDSRRWWMGWHWLNKHLIHIVDAIEKVSIVYDSEDPRYEDKGRHPYRNVSTRFVKDADAKIVVSVRKLVKAGNEVCVVTDDQELQTRCTLAGAEILPSRSFIELLVELERLAHPISAEEVVESIRSRFKMANGNDRVVLEANVVVLAPGTTEVVVEEHESNNDKICVWNVRSGVGDDRGYIRVEDHRKRNVSRSDFRVERQNLVKKLDAAKLLEDDERFAEFTAALANLDEHTDQPVFNGLARVRVVGTKSERSNRTFYTVQLEDAEVGAKPEYGLWFHFSRRLPEERFPAVNSRPFGHKVWQGPFNDLGAIHIVSSNFPLLEERTTTDGQSVVVRFMPNLDAEMVEIDVFGDPIPFEAIEWKSPIEEISGHCALAEPLGRLAHELQPEDEVPFEEGGDDQGEEPDSIAPPSAPAGKNGNGKKEEEPVGAK